MSGRVTYALNAHSELCVVHKLGGTPVSVDQMLECAHVAAAKVRNRLHHRHGVTTTSQSPWCACARFAMLHRPSPS